MEAKRIHERVRLRAKMTVVFIIGNESVAVLYTRSEIPNVLKFISHARRIAAFIQTFSTQIELTGVRFLLQLRCGQFFTTTDTLYTPSLNTFNASFSLKLLII